ncbi:MAG: dTMP kinase [Egibacteraceae bacterium]
MKGADPGVTRAGAGRIVGADTSAYRQLLRNRNYRMWFSATLASSLGDWMGFVALQILVASLYKAGSRPVLFALGGVMLARLAPSLLVGPIAGVLADRYDRRKLVVFTDLARCVLFVALAFSHDLTAIFTLAFVVECLSLLFAAAKDASLPAVVDRRQLTEANQLNLLVTYGTLPLGAVAAAAMLPVASLLQRVGVQIDAAPVVLLVDAATYLVSAVLMARLALPRQAEADAEADEGPGFLAEFREGVAFIRDFPLIRALITGVVGVAFGAGIVVALGPEFVRAEFGRPPGDWFTLMTSVGVGLVVGLAVTRPANRRIPKERLFPICLAATGGIASGMALVPSTMFALVLGLGVLLGAAGGLGIVQGYTLLYEHTQDETRARTFAAFYTGTRVALFSALGFGPFIAGTVGTVGLFIAERGGSISGVRATILFGGLVGLFFGVTATRGMYRALRGQPERTVRLHTEEIPRERGRFIVFEGVEGSGKSTQARALARTLEAEGHTVVVTREPGGTPVAERLRALLLDPDGDRMEDRTEALLLAAARAEHVEKVVRPALEAGTIVVCDRFIDSSLAYQGHARGLGETAVAEINRWAVGGLLPDAVVLLDLDPEEGLRRAHARGNGQGAGGSPPTQGAAGSPPTQAAAGSPPTNGLDRMEGEDLDFHRRVAEGYRQLARADRERFVVIDALADEATVADEVRRGLEAWLPLPTVAAR